MSPSDAGRILVLLRPSDTADRWRDALRHAGMQIQTGPETDPPEVVVIDQPFHGLDNVGVVHIGSEGRSADDRPPDVCLPDDATDRELVLACRLLVQIVRLRHRPTDGDNTTEDRQVVRCLRRAAQTDPLTGLPNRRTWDASLARRLAEHGDDGGQDETRLCLAVLDLDHFKPINDTAGHAAGDAVLRAAARSTLHSLRSSDLVARLGGDEFGLLMSVPDEQTAQLVLDRVRIALAMATTSVGYPVTASIGFCVTGPVTESLPSPDELFHAADTALLTAKRTGRNRVVAS